MNYENALEYIHSLEKFGIKPGLERISALLSLLGNPQDKLKFIHIAGTNGKGSTSTFCSQMLRCAGYNVGLYTSPYVIDFRERIQFNGEMIKKEELAELTEIVKNAIEQSGLMITEFEAVTAIAFLYYADKCCDYAVFEVGLGGRFDATNVIKNPLCSCITSISLDHIQILGNNITQIATEKCGIIKNSCPVIAYPLQNEKALTVIRDTVRKAESSLAVPDISSLKIIKSDIFGSEFEYQGETFSIKLSGKHMIYNCITAIECVKTVLPSITLEQIKNGLLNTTMPARIEIVSKKPLIIIDGGHNEDCANALTAFINSNLTGKRLIMISSLMADKDYRSYLEKTAPLSSLFIATEAKISRALPASKLELNAKDFVSNTICIVDGNQAVDFAVKNADENTAIIVCGSFYLASDIRNNIIQKYSEEHLQ